MSVQPIETRANMWTIRQNIVILFAGLALGFGLALLGGVALRASGLVADAQFTNVLGLLSGLGFAGGALVARQLGKLRWADLGLRAPGLPWLLLALFAGFSIPIINAMINLLIFTLLGVTENPQLDALLPQGFTWTGFLSTLLVVGLIVPFGEELFFRGVVFQSLRERLGIWPGIVVSAFVFALLHFTPVLLVGLTLVGIVTAVLFHYSRSVWPAVIVHAINNSLAVILLYLAVALNVL